MIIDCHCHYTGDFNEMLKQQSLAGVNKSIIFHQKSIDYEWKEEVPDSFIPFQRLKPDSELRGVGFKVHYKNDGFNKKSLRRVLSDGKLVILHTDKRIINEVKPLIKEVGTKVIAAHAINHVDYYEAYKECPNLYVDTSIKMSPLGMKRFMSIDKNRVVFGSDYPYSTPLIERKRVELNPYLSEQEKNKILGLNIKKLFKSGKINIRE